MPRVPSAEHGAAEAAGTGRAIGPAFLLLSFLEAEPRAGRDAQQSTRVCVRTIHYRVVTHYRAMSGCQGGWHTGSRGVEL